ncbi:MAG TPA: GNAT family N-acetyltransferase [Methylomirabilota bacterium]|jgi:phosphinothricin acetyltransferase
MSRDQIDRIPSRPDSSVSSIAIRDADERDLVAINAIFNREIAESAYVYAEVPITLDERRAWLQMHRAAGLPVVVATGTREGTDVLGWASLSPYRAASGYRSTLEASVYVAHASHRRGIGRRLLATLDEAARARGVHAIVASIDSENTPSITLFERFGYTEAARLTEVGRKFERWRTQLLLLKGF